MGMKYNDKVLKSLLHPSGEQMHKEWTYNSFDFEKYAIDNIANSFKKIYPHDYEKVEIRNLIGKFINDTTDFSYKFNRLYLIRQLSNKLLNHAYSESTVNFSYYFDWIGITNKISEELLTETIKGMNGDLKPSRYLMNVPHDFYSLNKILDDPLVPKSEQHMHINASSLNFNMSYYGLTYLPSTFSKMEIMIESYNPKTDTESDKYHEKIIMYKVTLMRHALDLLANNNEKLKTMGERITNITISNNPTAKVFEIIMEFDLYNMSHRNIAEQLIYNSNVFIQLDDYDISSVDELYEFLDIERSFIRNIVYQFKDHDVYNNYVFMYIYYKNLCHEIFVSKNTRSTFANFKHKQDNKSLFLSEEPKLVEIYYKSIAYVYIKDNVNKLEWRISPNVDFNKQFKMIKKYSNQLNHIKIKDQLNDHLCHGNDKTINNNKRNQLNFKPVIHFIKKDFEEKCEHNPNHNICNKIDEYKKLINQYKLEAYNIKKLAIKKAVGLEDYQILGVDAASDELVLNPEILGSAFRIMRTPVYVDNNYIASNPLKFTFHVGEVYSNVLTGVRRVDEVIDYLQFQSGDRIGHGVALGIDVEKEYSCKTSSYQNLGERLDDLIWLYDNLVDNHYEDATNILKLKQEIDCYLSKINNALSNCYPLFTLEEYRKSLKLRSDVYDNNYVNLEYKDLILKSESDKDILSMYNFKLKGYSDAFQNKNAKILYELYRTNSTFCDVYNESIQVKNNIGNMVEMVSYAQRMIRKKLARKDITIEVNISSNYFISSMTRYSEHPLFIFVPIDKSQQKDSLQVSINTDDSAIFQTSINREYSIIAKTLVSQGYSNIEVCEYIERLIKMSNRTSWIKNGQI